MTDIGHERQVNEDIPHNQNLLHTSHVFISFYSMSLCLCPYTDIRQPVFQTHHQYPQKETHESVSKCHKRPTLQSPYVKRDLQIKLHMSKETSFTEIQESASLTCPGRHPRSEAMRLKIQTQT